MKFQLVTLPNIMPAKSIISCGVASLLLYPALYAGQYGATATRTTVQSSSTEITRREQYATKAQEAVRLGDEAMEGKDYETAFGQYRLVLDITNESPETTALRSHAREGLCDAGVKLGAQRITEGRYDDAKVLCQLVLEDRYAPECAEAELMLRHLADPEYFNKTSGPKFLGRVEEVKQLLLEGKQFHQTGRYDLATKRYDQVLNLDPYNSAARKGQEQVAKAKSEYAIDGYNEARSRMLWEVDRRWQSPVRDYSLNRESDSRVNTQNLPDNQALLNRLTRIIVPQIQFRDATVREAVDFLKQKSVELDTTEPDPAKRGVNIVLKMESAPAPQGITSTETELPAEPAIPGLPEAVVPEETTAAVTAPAVDPAEARITLSLRQVPLLQALTYIADLSGLKVKVDEYAVAVVPQDEPVDYLITKEYRVKPDFIPTTSSGGNEADSGGFGGGNTTVGAENTGLIQRRAVQEFLEGNGVKFPPGSAANFLPSSSRLIVRNSQENIDLIDTLVAAGNGQSGPTQVEIESKFVEVQQNNLKELSFDLLLGQANIPGRNERVFFGGGTTGTSQPFGDADFPFVDPNAGVVGTNPVTAGNRSGNNGISNNAIDALLANFVGSSNIAPGVLSLAGVFTDPQFQLVMRALNQKKGIDLLSAPRVTTKSGQRAVVEIIREFRYPTEFDPPQIPQQTFVSDTIVTLFDPLTGFNSNSSSSSSFPVTPTTPTAFETRNTGITLEVEPIVGPDGYTIDLNLVPQVVEFDGFINYGSPITSSSISVLGIPQTTVLTANVINQPVFSTRKITTSVSIWDGQTVVLGGLIREDVQKVEDKVPLLGDIPILGRVFRSSIDQHIKRNLTVFVTARLIDAAGNTILKELDENEQIEVLAPPRIESNFVPEAPLLMKGK